MPSPQPLPTIGDHLTAAQRALIGSRDRYGDARRGSMHEHTAGPMAVILSREADRDSDAFRAIYIDDADGKDLTRDVDGRLGVERVLDTYGEGTAHLVRPNGSGGAGKFFEGTRIRVAGSPPVYYEVAQDTAAGATALSLQVPIRATVIGSGTALATQTGLSFEDIVYDAAWSPVSLQCEDGTDFEDAATYRARARQETLDERFGYLTRLVQACKDAGAAYVVPFASHEGLDPNTFTESDVSPVFVSVSSFTSPTTVIYPAPHGLADGEYVQLFGAAPLQLNGVFEVAVASPRIVEINVTLPANQFFSARVTSTGRGDYGLNALYVADQNFASSDALVNACRVAVEGARVLGADLWVGGMTQQSIALVATLNLVDDPSRLATIPIKRAAAAAALAYFGPTQSGYIYKLTAIGGAIVASHPAIQAVTFTSPSSDPTLTPRAWPASLPRYVLNARDIAFTLAGPV